MALFWTWFGVAVFIFVMGFIIMAINVNIAKGFHHTYQKNRYTKPARAAMWVSLLSPVWPAIILVGPALLIKWMVSVYCSVAHMEVSK